MHPVTALHVPVWCKMYLLTLTCVRWAVSTLHYQC